MSFEVVYLTKLSYDTKEALMITIVMFKSLQTLENVWMIEMHETADFADSSCGILIIKQRIFS